MYKVEFYKLGSGQWRWKFSYNKFILARSEKSYGSKGVAQKAYAKFRYAVKMTP